MRVYDIPNQFASNRQWLSLKASEDANETLGVVDELWKDDHFEARDLAAHLLGQVPVSSAKEVLERLRQWSSLPWTVRWSAVFVKGSQRLRAEDRTAGLRRRGCSKVPLRANKTMGFTRFRFWSPRRVQINCRAFFAGCVHSSKATRV